MAVERDQTLLASNRATAVAALEQANADIIGLQEIDFDAYRSFEAKPAICGVVGIADALCRHCHQLGQNATCQFPYWPPAVHYKKVISGQAMLSRYPITQNERIVLEKVPNNPFYYNALYLDRVAQVAEIDLGNQSLVVINVHLEAFDAPTRTRQERSCAGPGRRLCRRGSGDSDGRL
jgi:endonuclease/exonuclease/phosphatase family metal-dependent hydrolase